MISGCIVGQWVAYSTKHLVNAFYHVTRRGNARQNIFFSDADRLAFLDLLGRSAGIYQTEIPAYVLMNNHFHLLVKTPRGNLQEFMPHFNISYTVYFNRQRNRSCHLYQGRYHSFLIDANNYLEALDYFGGDRSSGRRGYARYVEQGLAMDLENPLELGKGHGIIGETDFVDTVRDRYLSPAVNSREMPAAGKLKGWVESERIVEAICSELKVERAGLMKKGYRGAGRGLLMELLYRYGRLNQRQIGAMMDIDYNAVSIGRKRFLLMMETDPELRTLYSKAENRIRQG